MRTKPISKLLIMSLFKTTILVLTLTGASLHALKAQDQIIPIDTVAFPDFKHTSYIFVQPVYGSFLINAGHRLMKNKLDQAGVDTQSLREVIYFGAAIERNKWMYGLDLALPILHLNSPTNRNRNNRTQVTDGTNLINFEVGYSILYKENVRLLLKGGVGYMERNLIVNKASTNASFDFENFESLPLESWPNFQHRNAVFNVGLEFLPRPREKLAVLYSTKIGYCRSFGASKWRADNVNIQNALEDRISTFYIKTSIAIARSR